MRFIAGILTLIFLAACSGRPTAPADALFVNGDIEVFADSMTVGGKLFIPVPHTSALVMSSESPVADALTSSELADTALTPLSIWMSGAMLDPERSMEALRALTDRGRVKRDGFPVEYRWPEWGAAAWEVYCATGSMEWLREAYSTIMTSLRAERPIAGTSEGLMRGSSPRLDTSYPSWMTAADRTSSLSFYVNIFHWHTLEVAAAMADTLGLGASVPLRLEAKEARNAINNRFWLPPFSRYGAMLYSEPYPILAQTSDCGANAAATLLSLPIAEMSAALVKSFPTLAEGIPQYYPLGPGTTEYTPETQALMAMAAADADNETAFCNSVGALWAMSAKRDVSREWTAVLLKSLLGLHYTPNGIEVHPFIPEKFSGSRTIGPLPYRDATLTFTLHGTGDRIASFSIDSIAGTPFIAPTLTGHHDIEIVMASNRISDGTSGKSDDDGSVTLPPMPKIEKTAPNILTTQQPEEGMRYGLYLNGTLSRLTEEPIFAIPADSSVLAVTTVAKDGLESLSSAPVIDPKSVITVSATSITPRRPPLNLIKDRETATRYIELAPRHNTRLTFYVNIPEAGRYFVRIVCSNGSSATAIRTLGIIDSTGIDRPTGILVSPTVREADWITTAPSTWAEAELTEGPNRLSLTYMTGTVLLNRIELIRRK